MPVSSAYLAWPTTLVPSNRNVYLIEAVERNMIYNSPTYCTTCTTDGWHMSATNSTALSNGGTMLYANCYAGTGNTTGNWVRLVNGREEFGQPCNTEVVEWVWANDGEHQCTVAYHNGFVTNGFIYTKPLSAEEQKVYDEKMLKRRIHEIMQSRCSPNIIVRNNSKRQALPMPADIREQRARETLRRVVGDNKFANYIKHGFISVKAQSGLIYQIFSGHGITSVFDQGKMVDRLCVVLNGSFPPTDSLIMRYILILNNEHQFRSFAVKHSVTGYQTNRPLVQMEMRPLSEIFKDLKKKVAA